MRIDHAEIPGVGSGCVRIAGGRITELAPRLEAIPGEPFLDADGGALLPGLHDHHLHLLAMAAAFESVACGPPKVRDAAGLRAALMAARPGHDGWVRGVDYHESVAGPLDRVRLDAMGPDLPLRIQHRTGALWVVNAAGLAALGVGAASSDEPEGLERDSAGRATGRLFRSDLWLRERIGGLAPPLDRVGRALARAGVTGVTDATPHNGPGEVALISREVERGALPQHVQWMGGVSLPDAPDGTTCWRKLVLDERTLRAPHALALDIAGAHDAGRPVAIHCVTRAELVVACAAIEQAGADPRDRIEHASVAPPDTLTWLARLGITVVTQPGFVYERGDRYRIDVDPNDRAWLYRCAGFDRAGVPLGAGSDAPYGAPDPWRAMQAAVDRRTMAGAALGEAEAITPERALSLFTSAPDQPGGAPRTLGIGSVADLCLLDAPWSRARERLASDSVRATFRAGRCIWDADSPAS